MKTRTNWTETLAQIVGTDCNRILLYGAPGTGKTTSATRIISNYHRATLSADSQPEDLIGSWILQVESGLSVMKWKDAHASLAMTRGETLILDEIDHAGSSLTSTLHAVLDDHAIAELTKGNGERCRPTAGYRVIATMNGSPNDLAPAVLDRFDAIIQADQPASGSLAGIPDSLVALLPPFTESNWSNTITPRTLRAFVRLCQQGIAEDTASKTVFGAGWQTILTAWTVKGGGL